MPELSRCNLCGAVLRVVHFPGWGNERWPDGDLVPVPFGSTCVGCRARVEFRTLWCPPCDDKRITRIETGFRDVAAAFEEAKA